MDRHDNEGLWDWNLKTGRVNFSPRWISMLGYEEHEVGNAPGHWFDRIHPDDLKQLRTELDSCLAGNLSEFSSQHRMRHKDGTYRWMSCRATITRDEQGIALRVAGSHSDVTAEKVSDARTGLPNRLLFLDRLSRSIERNKRHKDFLYAVLFLNLDRFQSLNERLGSAAGDQLLVIAARRMETCLRTGEAGGRPGWDHVVARVDGDEFAILLDGLNEVGEAKAVAERLLKGISLPIALGGHEVFLTASIGIALSVTGYSRPEEALRDADTAMYRAKSLGRARCEVFDTAVLNSAETQIQLEAELEWALERQEFEVYYQPIISLASGEIVGFEALVRWNHPARGLVSPAEFIPIAEKTGLVDRISRWVLREACRQTKVWQERPGFSKELWISVNCSSSQLRQPSLVEFIEEVLYNTGLEPRHLILELTESVVMENPEAARSLLMQLRVMGVQIGLDDFGAGYSSLGYLRQLPVDFLKIDRSFIHKMETSRDAAEIVRTITGLTHQLGLHVISEGIEETEQRDLVRSLGCDYGQGFLFSQAVNAESATALLNSRPCAGELECSQSVVPVFGPDRESVPACVVPDGPVIEHARPRWNMGSVLSAVAALVLLCAIGIVTRIESKVSPPADSSVPRSQALPEASQTPLVEQPAVEEQPLVQAAFLDQGPLFEWIKAKPAPAAPKKAPKTSTPERKERDAAVETRAAAAMQPAVEERPVVSPPSRPVPVPPEPVPDTYPVIHEHVIGSCRGVLKISADAISYIPEKGNDGFTYKAHEYWADFANDRLVIKSGSKTFRFRSAVARDKTENRALLQNIVQGLSGSRLSDTESKKN